MKSILGSFLDHVARPQSHCPNCDSFGQLYATVDGRELCPTCLSAGILFAAHRALLDEAHKHLGYGDEDDE